MNRTLLKSKIHRATVSEANIEYEGSVTIDKDLHDAADMLPYERVDIWNCTNGNRLSTYVIEGERGLGQICINGAAAHLMKPGDKVILNGWGVGETHFGAYAGMARAKGSWLLRLPPIVHEPCLRTHPARQG